MENQILFFITILYFVYLVKALFFSCAGNICAKTGLCGFPLYPPTSTCVVYARLVMGSVTLAVQYGMSWLGCY